ncbi:MAG: PHP domain-containing protein [Thermodesulfobacteriota bacterium]
MLKEFPADLHIHTCLSPCAELDLSPRAIIQEAQKKNLKIIAITDHNTAQNVRPVMFWGEQAGIKVLPGMEVQTKEEVHLLTIFPDSLRAALWDAEAYQHLPAVKNDPQIFGDQPVVDEEGNILKFEERVLLNSLALSVEEVKKRVAELGGLVIPSHFDKESYSLISQLGFIPNELAWEALEMSRRNEFHLQARWEQLAIPRIISSDAHRLADIGSAYTIFLLAEPTLAEIRLALQGREGRRILHKVDKGAYLL